jgi:PHD/YefM family antitoxin component YafN of YafNO toxin-antitoxin module
VAVTASSEQVAKNFGRFQDAALSEPVVVTKYGRASVVIVKATEYERLKKRDREVLSIGDLTREDVAAIGAAKPPSGLEHLDKELE